MYPIRIPKHRAPNQQLTISWLAVEELNADFWQLKVEGRFFLKKVFGALAGWLGLWGVLFISGGKLTNGKMDPE